MHALRCIFALASLAVMAAASAEGTGATMPAGKGATTRPTKPLRVLFVGNSYTYCNELPRMLERFGQAAGRRIETSQSISGGWTLEKHWLAGRARKAIAGAKWDYVVLQEQSQLPIVRPKLMHKYVRLFDKEIRKAGAKTALFLTWARRNKPHQQKDLTSACALVARELGATVVPVGEAWRKALSEKPGLVLHESDDSHPTAAGSYLAACVFYAALTGQSPEGLPAEIVINAKIGRSRKKVTLAKLTEKQAAFYQRIARATIKTFAAAATQPAAKAKK